MKNRAILTTLKDGWQWVDPSGDSGFSLTANSGYLRLNTPDGEHDLYMNLNAPRLVQPITGDFLLATQVTINPQYNDQGAGILIWENENNFIRLERTLVKGINLSYRINGTFGTSIEIPTSNPSVQLRIQRSGNDIKAWYKDASSGWVEAGTLSYPAGSTLLVGLSLINNGQDNPISADFDYFHLDWCSQADKVAPPLKVYLPLIVNP